MWRGTLISRTTELPVRFNFPYLPPIQAPLYWRNWPCCHLPNAIIRYFDHCLGHCPDETAKDLGVPPLTTAETALVIGYCIYFIEAPCWDQNMAQCEERLSDLRELRTRAQSLASVESIRRWNGECSELGLDPF